MTIKERVQEVFNKFNVALEVEDKIRVDMAEETLENGTVIYTDADDFAEGEEAYIINDEGERIPLPPGDYKLADGGTISIGDLGKISKVDKPQGGDAKNEGKPDAKGVDGKPNIDPTKQSQKARRRGTSEATSKRPCPGKPGVPGKKKKLSSEEDESNEMKVEFNQEEVLAVLNERFPDLGEELSQAIAAAVAEVYAEPEVEAEKDEDEEMGYKDKEEMQTEEVAEEVTEEVAEEIEVEVEMSEDKPEKTELESLKEALAQTNAKLEELQKFAAEPGLKHKAPTPKVEKLDLANMTIEERVRALANQLSK